MIKRVDSGGQVHLVTNIRKPRKWRRYEYLLSSGRLYIDTGVALSLTDKFEFETDFTYSPANDKKYPFYGTENYLTGFMALYHYSNNNLFPLWIKSTSYGGYDITINAESHMYSKTVIDVPNKTWAIIYNTTSANGTYSDLITDTTSTVKFFGNDLFSKYVTKCYYFKIKINDTLVRDFVPAQYNGQYGMWDLVEDRFYPNKGTGSFTVGPEMKNYDEINEVRKTTSLLPAGVELYDYILSSGTLYIDSGWITDYTKSFEITSKYNASSSGNRGCILSAYNAANATSLEVTTNSRFWLHDGNKDNVITASVGVNHVSIFNYGGGTWKHQVDGGTALTGSASYSDSAAASAYMFLDRALRTSIFNKLFKIYYLSIKENGVLIRNFLPCAYLGEPGMWDTVENKFYRNQGTGLFTLGNKITLKEYEYLQSSGTQWIDTGINADSTLSTKFKLSPTTISESSLPMGTIQYISGNYYRHHINNFNGPIGYYIGGLGIVTTGNFVANTDYEFDVNMQTSTLTINGQTVSFTTSSFNTSLNYWLFRRNSNTESLKYYGKLKLYYCLLRKGTELVRDFIPVSYNGTPGLWDKVEWKFYGNAGSGSFTLGPEKASGSIYLYDNLTNLFNGFIGGGQMTLSNGILVGTGNNSDTYFYTKTTQAVNTTSYYLVGLYVEGYTSATAWPFRSPQSNSNATLKITRDGWNWGYVKFSSSSQPIWDDAAKPSLIPKITISDCRIYKIT